jgi:hypothetical protein
MKCIYPSTGRFRKRIQATLLADFGVDADFEESTVIHVERPTG